MSAYKILLFEPVVSVSMDDPAKGIPGTEFFREHDTRGKIDLKCYKMVDTNTPESSSEHSSMAVEETYLMGEGGETAPSKAVDVQGQQTDNVSSNLIYLNPIIWLLTESSYDFVSEHAASCHAPWGLLGSTDYFYE